MNEITYSELINIAIVTIKTDMVQQNNSVHT